VRSQKLMELQRQKEIIEQWLQTPGIPTDAHAKLLDMLSEVNAEMGTNRFVTSNQNRDGALRLPTLR
jgi:cell division FtsZ-interacting protein ZapD